MPVLDIAYRYRLTYLLNTNALSISTYNLVAVRVSSYCCIIAHFYRISQHQV